MKKLILTAVIAVSTMVAAIAQERVDVVSSKNFKQTIEALNKAIKSKSMMVVATVDHQNMLKMVGTKIGGATTIEFGKPDMGKMLFSMHPEAGLEMPARIYVYEKGGKVTMSFYKSNYTKYDKMLAEMDKMMDMMCSEIVGSVK